MSFEDKEAELGLLLSQMQDEPEDWHELYERIRLKLNELRAFGMPLPDDLVEFERDLEAEMRARKEAEERRARIDRLITQRTKRGQRRAAVPERPPRKAPRTPYTSWINCNR